MQILGHDTCMIVYMHDSVHDAVLVADVVEGLPLEVESFQFSEYFCHYILRSTLRSDTKMPLGTEGREREGGRERREGGGEVQRGGSKGD